MTSIVELALALLACVALLIFALPSFLRAVGIPIGSAPDRQAAASVSKRDRIMVVLTMFIAIWAFRLRDDIAPAPHSPLIGLLTWALCWPVVVFAHELGHLAMARAWRIPVDGFRVGPAALMRQAAGWKLTWDRAGLACAGAVLMRPRPDERAHRIGMIFAIAAGPAASLIFAVYAYSLALDGSAPGRFDHAYSAAATLSLIVAIGSMLPFGTHTLASDGLRLAWLIRGGAATRLMWGSLCLNGAEKRPRDWDEALVRSTVAPEGAGLTGITQNLFGYCFALDSQRFDEAGRFLDRAAELALQHRIPSGEVFYECAYFEARHRGNPVKAREWLDRAGTLTRLDAYAIPRCRAAALIAEGRVGEARQALAEARAALAAVPRNCDTAVELEFVSDLEQRIAAAESRATEAAPPLADRAAAGGATAD
jgi:hypothetical protein